MNLGEAVLRISAHAGGFTATTNKVITKLRTIGKTAQAVGMKMRTMGMQASFMGAAIVAALTPAIVAGASFEKQMSSVVAVVDELRPSAAGAAEAFAGFTEQVLHLGATTEWTARQVAEAAHFLGLAGFSLQEIQEALPATLQLATAGSLDLGRAAEIAADTLRAFGLEAHELGRVVDALAKAATTTNTTVEKLGESMRYAAPLSASLGQTVEQTAAALGLLANAGIKASRGGTVLANMQAMLVKNTEKADKIMRRHGMTFRDINPEVQKLATVILNLKEANLSALEVLEIFRLRAGRGVLAFMTQSEEKIRQVFAGLEDAAGVAKEMQEIKLDNITGAFVLLKSILEGVAIDIFNAMKTDLEELLTSAREWVAELKTWIGANEELVASIGKFAAGLGLVLITVGPLLMMLGMLTSAVGGLYTAFAGLVGLLATNPIALGAMLMALPVLLVLFKDLKAALRGVNTEMRHARQASDKKILMDNQHMRSLEALAEKEQLTNEEMKEATRLIEGLEKDYGDLGIEVDETTKSITGLAAGQERYNAAVRQRRITALNKEIRELRENLTASVDAAKLGAGWWRSFLNKVAAGLELNEDLTEQQNKALQKHHDLLNQLIDSQAELNALQAGENVPIAGGGDPEAMAREARRIEMQARILEQEAEFEKQLKKVAKIEAEIFEDDHEGRAGAIRELEQQAEVRQKVLQDAIDLAEKGRVAARAQEEAAAAEVRMLQEKGQLGSELLAQKQVEEQLARGVAEAREQELQRLQHLREQNTIFLEQQTQKELLEEKEDRLKFMEDMRIAESRYGKDKIETARLEAEQRLRIKKKEIEETFALSKELSDKERKLAEQQKAEALKLAEAAARAHVKKAMDEEAEKKKKTTNIAKRELELERSISGQLVRRVRSLRDILMLYQAIAIVRQIQENRARIAADQAILAEEKLSRLYERRARMKDDSAAAERLDLLIRRTKTQAEMSQQIAGKRAEEAQLPGASEASAMLVERLAVLQDDVLTLHHGIAAAFQSIANDFQTAPVLWVDAFVGAWQIEAQRMVDAVQFTMQQIKVELDPATTHSPSLLQVMDMNVAAVAGGVGKVVGSLEQALPRLRSMSISRALASPPAGRVDTGGALQPMTQTLNDNRRVEMQVNNNLDLDSVERRIGNALQRSGMQGGGM